MRKMTTFKNPKQMKCLGVVIAVGIAVLLGMSSSVASAGKSVNTTAGVPSSMSAELNASSCTNHTGPFITLEGEIVLSEVNARLIFRNNRRGTHERSEDVTLDIKLLSEEVIRFAKQPPLGGVGGNPWIYLTLVNDDGQPVTRRVLLGRCVQGLLPANIEFLHAAEIGAEIAANCSNSPGPFIDLSGEISFEGIHAVLTFQNSRSNAPHVREEAVDIDIEIVPAGGAIHFAKQPPLGGVGGNPRISLKNGYQSLLVLSIFTESSSDITSSANS